MPIERESEERMEREMAQRNIEYFVNHPLHNQSYYDLLLYAAIPNTLTPELLGFLRERFAPNTPWVAQSDLFNRATFCHVRSYESYYLEKAVRNELLEQGKGTVNQEEVLALIAEWEKTKNPR